MPVSSANGTGVADKGGLTRDYAPMHNHTMVGAADEKLLQNAVTMKSTAQRSGDQVQVVVNISNDKTGHDVPTDAPIRSMILVVEALDADGKPVAFSQGPGNPAYSGNYGGRPVDTLAKILTDKGKGGAPRS